MRGLDKHLAEFKEITAKLPNGLSERLDTFVGNLSLSSKFYEYEIFFGIMAALSKVPK